ncbi:hypothetical protein N9H77_01235 [Porticoccaceae bacterium]|nr:hypothetical protein [Porticoccaceae bacterium]MDB4559156.1 hypothetical protein [bacterium]
MAFSVATISTLVHSGSSTINGTEFVYSGGEKTLSIFSTASTFGGATVKIQASLADADNFIYLKDSEGADLAFTEDSLFKLDVGRCRIRFVATNASSGTSIIIKAS